MLGEARLLLPITLGAGMLRDLMARDQSWDLSELATALLNGIAYLAIGLFVFRWAENRAKSQGRIGEY